jgi:hypothetical protein
VGFLVWLEASALADWVRVSYVGYPMMIASHAIGMAIMVGLSVVLALRVLGWFDGIPYHTLYRFLGIAWVGFGLNFLSGLALFTSQATYYIVDVTFLTKMGLVLAGAAAVAMLQTSVGRDALAWRTGADVPGGVRLIAIASIVCWVGATITGRLIAYL